MPPQRNPDLENDKDAVLVSIYGPLDQIVRLMRNKAPNAHLTSSISGLKTHAHGFLKYIFDDTPDNDANYRNMPKTTTDLMGKTGAMLSHIDRDITSMRGYLNGKPRDTYIVLFRHLRDYVDAVLAVVSKAPADEDTVMSGLTSLTLIPEPANTSAPITDPKPLPKPALVQGSRIKPSISRKEMNKKSPNNTPK